MELLDPRLFSAAGLDPYATIDEIRSADDIRNQRITYGSLGALAAIIAIAYILFGDGFR